MFHAKGFRSITTSYSALDLVVFSNEALSLSILHKKSVIETNAIRLALYKEKCRSDCTDLHQEVS